MAKALIRFVLLKLLPGSAVSAVVIFASFNLLTAWHGHIYQPLWLWLHDQPVEAPEYGVVRVGSAQSLTMSGISLSWPPPRDLVVLDAFEAKRTDTDEWQTMPGFVRESVDLVADVSRQEIQLYPHPDKHFWRPVSDGGYKRIVVRNDQGSFVDYAAQSFYQEVQVQLSKVMLDFVEIDIDLWGGQYLFFSNIPEPEFVSGEQTPFVYLTSNTSIAKQFLIEAWAIKHEQWLVSDWRSIALAILMFLLPWLIFPQVKSLFPWALGFTTANVLLTILLLFQWQLAYPVIAPFVAILICLLWLGRSKSLLKTVAEIQAKRINVTKLWLGHLLDEGKPSAALRQLREQDSDIVDTSLWQLVANGFERDRRFDKSLECYQHLLSLDPNNQEAKTKVKQLSSVLEKSQTVAIGAAKDELPVGKVSNLTLGRYEIVQELGRGAMGVVYEAQDSKIHRKVALKVVHLKNLAVDEVEQVKQRFFREAQAAGQLNHPNIVTVYDVGEEHDVAYIAMDLLVGKPLSDYIGDENIDIEKMVRWIAQAAEALNYAHEHNVIHRDVKPANMIVEAKSGRLKLTDFGVARIAGVNQTQTGIVLGSPSYMAPEQIRGEALTGKTDLFSLGVTLYQAITGALPFTGETLPALAYAITQTKQLSPSKLNSNINVSLVRIVNRALQKDANDRFETGQQMADSLKKWLAERVPEG